MKRTIWTVYVILMIVSLHFVDHFYGNDLDSDMESMAEVTWAISASEEDEVGHDYEIVEVR